MAAAQMGGIAKLARIAATCVVLAAWASGCIGSGSGHSISFLVKPYASERFVEFNESEFRSTPSLRFLERALMNATPGAEETPIPDDELDSPSAAVEAIRVKWREKDGPNDPTETVVRSNG